MADYAIHDTTLTDISNVIRKKEGSSALIDPADYADRINLMGMLEKKIIVSSPICDFTDGSDDVPTDFVKIAIPANLGGKSAVTETQIPSRNMASMSDADFTLNSVHYYTENGVLYIDGTSTSETSSNNNAFKVLDFWLPSGTYYFSRGTTLTSLNVPAYLKKYDDKSQIVVNTGSFTLSEKTHLYIGLYVYQKTFSNIKAEICINLGSTAITYEDTAPMTQYSANLGRTVYGAEVDFVSGEGKEICGKIVFDGSESRWAEYTTGNGYAIPLTGMKRGTWYTSPLALSYPLPKAPNNDNLGVRIGVNNDGIYVVQANTIEGVTDLASFKAWLSENPLTIIYPLDTENDFTFDGQEIDTMLGYNAFWSEDGDTSVAYRASGTIYQYPSGEEASF